LRIADCGLRLITGSRFAFRVFAPQNHWLHVAVSVIIANAVPKQTPRQQAKGTASYTQRRNFVKQTKAIVLTLVIMALSLFGLYACGGETPTATPVPPSPTPVPPSPTPQAAKDATSDEIATIKEALANASELKSYHFTMDVAPSDFITQPVKAEGDYVAPNTTYIKGTMGGRNIEQIVVGDKIFEKGSNGQWTEKQKEDTSSDPLSSFNPDEIASGGNPVEGIGSLFEQVKTYKNEGTETMNGVQVTKYSFKLDLSEMMGSEPMPSGVNLSSMDLGGGAIWIDTSAKNLHKIDLNLNLGPIMELLVQAFSGLMGTPGPGTPTPAATPFPQMAVNLIMTISKHNDPSISIPLTAEMKQAQSEPTPEAFPTVEDFPTEEVATPEEASTPEAFPTFPSLGGLKETVTGGIGEPLTLGETTLTVDDVQRTTDGNLPPDAGNEYMMITVTVENNSSADLTLSGLLSFALTDSTGKDQSFAIGAKYTNMFDSVSNGTIKAGDKVTGELGYEVKQGTKDLKLKFTPNILNNEANIIVTIDK
jgi:hypothetical protein